MTNERARLELVRLRDAVDVPPPDPERERALLTAFDAHWARRRASGGRGVWMTAAATLTAIVLALDWFVMSGVSRPNRPIPNRADATPESLDETLDLTGFVPWPGAHAWPPLESGRVIRVDLPVAALPALGLFPPAAALSVVQADLVVGQDGFARAVRVVR